MPTRPRAHFGIPQAESILSELKAFLDPPTLASHPDRGFERSVTRGESLIVTNGGGVLEMLNSTVVDSKAEPKKPIFRS